MTKIAFFYLCYMKRFYYLLAITGLCFTACHSPREAYTINGTVPGDAYEQEYVFLVPIYRPATATTVDSVRITNRTFTFTGIADTAEVRILRTRPQLREALQPLLIIVEKGNISVALDIASTGGGTPQNDALQKWKTQKEQYDETLQYLYQIEKDTSDEATLRTIKEQREKAKQTYSEFNATFVKDNKGTAAGTFVSSVTKQ